MSIGIAARRLEGHRKVTGAALYSADHQPEGVLHAVIVGAPIARGTVERIDADGARSMPGVVRVLTATDMPRFGQIGPPAAVLNLPMQDDRIRHEGEPVALVLAESIAAAEAACAAVKVHCRHEEPVVLGSGRRERPPEGTAEDFHRGDVEAGLGSASRRHEATYGQAPRHHQPMETSGTVASWHGDKLTLHDSVQASATVPPVIAAALGIKPGDIRVVAPHTGGGFGCKGYIWPHEILAAAAARIAGRPVKLHLRRSDQFGCVGYQPWMRFDVAIGADDDARLTAVRFDVINSTALDDTHVEPSSDAAKTMYATPALRTTQMLERVSLNLPTAMRAPVEGPGMWALESAMNELADALGVDPLEFRLRNHADVDPHDDRPWSSKKLREAYGWAAERYGWRDRHHRPRSDGPWRIGHGMATCSMGCFRFPAQARVRFGPDGFATVEANVHDIGTGAQTIHCQIAADELGLALDRVRMAWGDTVLPTASPTYGSSTTVATGSAVAHACRDLRRRLRLGAEGGNLAAALKTYRGGPEAVGEGSFSLPDDAPFNGDGQGTPYAMRTWGAIFIEVGVDPEFGLVRLRRAVAAYSAGRIINPLTARSQITGGIIFGWGKATMEESMQEPIHGRWLAKNLSNTAIPVNADIPADLTVHFVDEYDEHASAIGARGIGELGATGVDAAVAAAVHDAIGVRIRSLPILPGKILEALAEQATTPSGA